MVAVRDAVTEMALLALLWETAFRPSLQMWKLRLSREAQGALNTGDRWTWQTGAVALSSPCCLYGILGKDKAEVLVL